MSFRGLATFVLTLGAVFMISAQDKGGRVPERGFVPDEVTAVKIAEAVLAPIYGDAQVGRERPFHGVLVGGIWRVDGTLHGQLGGVATVTLRRSDGCIVSVTHGK